MTNGFKFCHQLSPSPNAKGVPRGRAANDARRLPVPVPRRLPQADGAQEPLVLDAASGARPSLCVQDSQGGKESSSVLLLMLLRAFFTKEKHSTVQQRT